LFNNDFVDVLTLELTTLPTPGSPVGFEGGSMTGVGVEPGAALGKPTVYSSLRRIIPVLKMSSLALLGLGLLCCLAALARRRSKAAHAQAFGQWRRAHHF
jgi:hypothetical protein